MPTSVSATIHRRIQWFDTDASTKYHNTVPLRLMEEAEAALLDRLGIIKDVYGWLPRVHVSIDYRQPLRFWDEIEVQIDVEEVGRTSIAYRFDVRRGGESCADGRVVAVLIDEHGAAREWPEDYRTLLTGDREPSTGEPALG